MNLISNEEIIENQIENIHDNTEKKLKFDKKELDYSQIKKLLNLIVSIFELLYSQKFKQVFPNFLLFLSWSTAAQISK